MDYLKLHLITISTHKFVPFRKLTTYVLQSTTVNIVLWNDLIIKNTRRNIQTQCVGRALNCSAVKPDFIHIYIYIIYLPLNGRHMIYTTKNYLHHLQQ